LATALQNIKAWTIRGRTTDCLGSLNANHLGAHVGQHHGGKWARPDASNFNDTKT
jgi:hypothetical protein